MRIQAQHSVRNRLVAVAVAAMLGMTLVPSASAAPAAVAPADLDKNQTITVTSSHDISGKQLVAIPLAYYSSAFADGATLTGFDLEDAGHAEKIVQALTAAGITPPGDQLDTTNPMLWVTQNLRDSNNSPWAGSLRNFVTQLNKQLTGVDGTNLTVGGNHDTMSASVKPGIYLIVDRTATGQAAIPMLNGTGINGITSLKGAGEDSATYKLGSVEYKASTIAIDKVFSTGDAEKHTAQIGDTVQYTVTTTVPNWTGYDDFDFRIDDDLSAGLTFVNVDNVIVGGNDITSNSDLWKATTPDGNNDFSIVFAPDGTDKGSNLISKKDSFPVGKDVTVKYTARLDEDAVIGDAGNPNSVNVVYSHNPNDPSQMDTVPGEHEPTVWTGQIRIKKHDNENQPLAGAKFNIKRDGTNVKFVKVSEDRYRVADTDEQGTTEVLESPASGIITVIGLNGDYQVVETESPFNAPVLPSFGINAAVTTDEHGETSATLTAPDHDKLVKKGTGAYAYEFDVLNVRNLFNMPKTGATWLTIYGVGAVCLLGGAVILLRRKQQD